MFISTLEPVIRAVMLGAFPLPAPIKVKSL